MQYSPLDLQRGVPHMQLLGTRYYMAFSPEAIAAADAHPDLTEIAASPPWKVYEVADSDVVVPLDNEPAVLEGLEDTNPEWQADAAAWFNDPSALDVLLASDGPDDWQRIEDGERPERRSLPEVRVSDLDEDDQSISFDVSRVGVPILVKTSYFPNWTASGAEGPYHVTPNLMVVVPTEEHVELTYGYTSVEYLGFGTSLAALGALVLLVRAGPVAFPERRRRRPALEPAFATTEGEGDGHGDDDAAELGHPQRAADSAEVFFRDVARDPEEFWSKRPTWTSGRAEGGAEPPEAGDGAEDPPGDGGAGGSTLLDPDRDLRDDDPGSLGP
jgi:hypothetical protein